MKLFPSLFLQGLRLHPAVFAVDERFIGQVLLKENAASLFHEPDASRPKFRKVLEQAVEFGKRARIEDWNEAWFDIEFGNWADERMNQEGAKSCTRAKWREKRARQRLSLITQR